MGQPALPLLAVDGPGGTLEFAPLPLPALGPVRQLEPVVADVRRPARLRIDPVHDHVDVPVRRVVVRHDQRLPVPHPELLQTLVDSPAHLAPVRSLPRLPRQRVVVHRLGGLPPRSGHPRQALEPRCRLRRPGHDPPSVVRPVRGQVPGVGPLDPLASCRLGLLARLRSVVHDVRRDALEGPADRCHLGDHGVPASLRRRTRMASWHRATAARVPEGAAAPAFRARAIWLRFTPIRFSSRNSAVPNRLTTARRTGRPSARRRM